jgi:hypothetical protein
MLTGGAAEKRIVELFSQAPLNTPFFDSRNGRFVKPFTEAADRAVESQDAA